MEWSGVEWSGVEWRSKKGGGVGWGWGGGGKQMEDMLNVQNINHTSLCNTNNILVKPNRVVSCS